MKRIALLLLLLSIPILADPQAFYPLPPDYPQQFADFKKQIPERGLIADEKAALTIGRAIVEAEFGAVLVRQAGDLQAHRDRDFWVIETQRTEDHFTMGGGYMVALSPRDGRIPYLTVGK